MAEVVGWVASGLVIVSLMATSVVRLRVIGLAASGAFIGYGVLIEAWPIVITNVVVAAIHLWRLRGLVAVEEFFEVLPVLPTSAYLAHFCRFYREDIHRFVPGYRHQPDEEQTACFILRNMVPAGVFVGVPDGDGGVEVRLDYVIPRYRDFKVGGFLYSPASGVFGPEVRRVWTTAATPKHGSYLRRMGFRPSGQRWILELADRREGA